MSNVRVAIDVGGTFTDIVVVDALSHLVLAEGKAPSTPPTYVEGVLDAVRVAAAKLGRTSRDLLQSSVSVCHGSTVATNTVLERRGAVTGLLCTKGFRDTLAIRRGRHLRGSWNIRAPRIQPLIPRHLRIGIDERVAADGTVVRRPPPDEVRDAVDRLRAEGIDAIAICFLHSYANPSNELEAAELVREIAPEVHLSVSQSIVPLLGEYERFSTAALDAYVGPRVRQYLADLTRQLEAEGLEAERVLMAQSNGGLTDVAACRERPVVTVLSGPSAGAAGAALISRHIGERDLIVLDMGGTTTDITLIRQGIVNRRDYTWVGDNDCAIPSVEVDAIGTGGGTIAYVDKAGILRVGPESAGAVPGPASYGLGGEKPTVTDANVLLGRLPDGIFRGGLQHLDVDAARRAIRSVAEPLGIDETEAAQGIIRLADQSVATAIHLVTVERGFDPRAFTLLAAGGAAGLQVGAIARMLGIRKVCIPRHAAVFCALGLLEAAVERDYFSATILGSAMITDASIGSVYGDLRERAEAELRAGGLDISATSFELVAAMRYPGHLTNVPVAVAEPGSTDTVGRLQRLFHERHELLFGFARPEIEVEIAYFKLTARLPADRVQLSRSNADGSQRQPRAASRLDVVLNAGLTSIPAIGLWELDPSDVVEGPALVFEEATTVLVHAGQTLGVDSVGNLLVQEVHPGSGPSHDA